MYCFQYWQCGKSVYKILAAWFCAPFYVEKETFRMLWSQAWLEIQDRSPNDWGFLVRNCLRLKVKTLLPITMFVSPGAIRWFISNIAARKLIPIFSLPQQTCVSKHLALKEWMIALIDDKNSVDVVYLDLTKVFNSVNHRQLGCTLQT